MTSDEWQVVMALGFNSFKREFEFHCGLPLEVHRLAQAGERCNRVEQSSHAAAYWRVQSAREHRRERAQFNCGKGFECFVLVLTKLTVAEQLMEQSQCGPARF